MIVKEKKALINNFSSIKSYYTHNLITPITINDVKKELKNN